MLEIVPKCHDSGAGDRCYLVCGFFILSPCRGAHELWKRCRIMSSMAGNLISIVIAAKVVLLVGVAVATLDISRGISSSSYALLTMALVSL